MRLVPSSAPVLISALPASMLWPLLISTRQTRWTMKEDGLLLCCSDSQEPPPWRTKIWWGAGLPAGSKTITQLNRTFSTLCLWARQAEQILSFQEEKKGESTIVSSIVIRSLCLCLWKLNLLHCITSTPKQCVCNANQPLSCICTTVITWKNLFNIRRLSGADEWLRHDIHGIEIQLKTASGTEVVVIVQHVPWGLCWNTAISCTGWEILFSFMTIC